MAVSSTLVCPSYIFHTLGLTICLDQNVLSTQAKEKSSVTFVASHHTRRDEEGVLFSREGVP